MTRLSIRSRRLHVEEGDGPYEVLVLEPWGPWGELVTSPETDAFVDVVRREIAARGAELREELERQTVEP